MGECMVCNLSLELYSRFSSFALKMIQQHSFCCWGHAAIIIVVLLSAKILDLPSNEIRWQILLVFSAMGLFLFISYINTKWLERTNFEIFPHCFMEVRNMQTLVCFFLNYACYCIF